MNHLIANWPAPAHVKALTTTRLSGKNLGMHVNDDPRQVLANREWLKTSLSLSSEPIWLDQTHSSHCIVVDHEQIERQADAAVTRLSQVPLVIMTADCLPIVICNQQGNEIAAIHAGWRGLAGGVIENTLKLIKSEPGACLAWIGPAICIRCYQTGPEVVDVFKSRYGFAEQAFEYHDSHFYTNLAKMAELILRSLGLIQVYQSNACTYELKEQFYSYRRESQTGRMATLIWFQDK